MGNTSGKGHPDNCDYSNFEDAAITTNAFLNIFGMGEIVDPVGCMYEAIGAVEAAKREFLDEMTFNMFDVNLVIAKQQVELSQVFAEYNKQLSEYYFAITNGQYNTVSITLPMITIMILVLFIYIFTLPLPQGA